MSQLTDDEFDELIAAAVDCGLGEHQRREVLLRRLGPELASSLPVLARPRDQMISDISELLASADTSESSALVSWLRAAVRVSTPHREASRLTRILDKLVSSNESATGPQFVPPRPLPQIVDELEDCLLTLVRSEDEREHEVLQSRADSLARRIRERRRAFSGDTLAGCKLIRPVGSGSFATVWLAQRPTGETAAVKIFHPDKLTQGLMLWRFRRSIMALERMNERKSRKTGIVRLLASEESGLAFAMEYLSGGNLEDVARRRWTLERKVEVFQSICLAVEHAHRVGVIHRDIKPANIVLNAEDQPILTDFDISDIKFAATVSLTKGGLGTPVFAAPEQIQYADTADERADIYSLGRLLYYMLLERSPGLQIEFDPSLTDLAGQPPHLVEVVRRATQYDPKRRFVSVGELLSEIDAFGGWKANVRAKGRKLARGMRNNRMLLGFTTILVGMSAAFAFAQSQHAAALQEQLNENRAKDATIAYCNDMSEGLHTECSETSLQVEKLARRLDEVSGLMDQHGVSLERFHAGCLDTKLRKEACDQEMQEWTQALDIAGEWERPRVIHSIGALTAESERLQRHLDKWSQVKEALQREGKGLRSRVERLRQVMPHRRRQQAIDATQAAIKGLEDQSIHFDDHSRAIGDSALRALGSMYIDDKGPPPYLLPTNVKLDEEH